MKIGVHLVGISIFSLNHVTVRPTKIVNRVDKNWEHFLKIKYLKNQNLQTYFLFQVGLLVQYSSKNFFGKIQPIFNTGKDFENQNFEIFEEVVHNFSECDGDSHLIQ